MLVLSRKVSEKIIIGNNITIVVTKIIGNRVTLGVVAPKDIKVIRKEVKSNNGKQTPKQQ